VKLSITKSVQSIIAKIRQFGSLKNFQAWKTCRQDTVFSQFLYAKLLTNLRDYNLAKITHVAESEAQKTGSSPKFAT
jgi:hypothetical protein